VLGLCEVVVLYLQLEGLEFSSEPKVLEATPVRMGATGDETRPIGTAILGLVLAAIFF